MTVAELIRRLQAMPGHLRVDIALRDPGGWDHKVCVTRSARMVEQANDRFGECVIITDDTSHGHD